jgi:hypothetical protein
MAAIYFYNNNGVEVKIEYDFSITKDLNIIGHYCNIARQTIIHYLLYNLTEIISIDVDYR